MSALASEAASLLQQRLDVERALPPPAQRDFNVPQASALKELRCAPEEKLLARCHAEFPQVFAAGMVRAGCGVLRMAGDHSAQVGSTMCLGLLRYVHLDIQVFGSQSHNLGTCRLRRRARVPTRLPPPARRCPAAVRTSHRCIRRWRRLCRRPPASSRPPAACRLRRAPAPARACAAASPPSPHSSRARPPLARSCRQT